MQPGCVELLSHPSSHMQELKKKKKKKRVIQCIENDSFVKLQELFPKLLKIHTLSLNFFRKEKIKRKSVLEDPWDVMLLSGGQWKAPIG